MHVYPSQHHFHSKDGTDVNKVYCKLLCSWAGCAAVPSAGRYQYTMINTSQ